MEPAATLPTATLIGNLAAMMYILIINFNTHKTNIHSASDIISSRRRLHF